LRMPGAQARRSASPPGWVPGRSGSIKWGNGEAGCGNGVPMETTERFPQGLGNLARTRDSHIPTADPRVGGRRARRARTARKNPPAEPGALSSLAPQRGLLATERRTKPVPKSDAHPLFARPSMPKRSARITCARGEAGKSRLPETSNCYRLPGRAGGPPYGLAVSLSPHSVAPCRGGGCEVPTEVVASLEWGSRTWWQF
jgi:hypothetical protein